MKLPVTRLAWFAPTLLTIGFAACSPSAPEPRVRNVILLSIDTLRADHLEAYGYERPTSPFMSELAGRGVLFEQAFSQAPWTLPAHGTMLMSRHPSALGEGVWERPGRLPEEAVSIAEVLRDAGLRTKAIVSPGFVSAVFGLDQGFEHYGEHERDFASTVKRAGRWLDGLASDERFFLFLHTYDVHEYAPTAAAAEQFVAPYDGFLRELGDKLPMFVQDRAMASDLPELDAADQRYLVDLYDATIRVADDAVAELWRTLEERGLADDTLLVITSDHGEEFFEHGNRGHKMTLFDETVRVPLLVVLPKALRGAQPRAVDVQVSLSDIMPTILDVTGIDAPETVFGRSLRPALEGRPLAPGAEVTSLTLYTYPPGGGLQVYLYDSIRTAGSKLIRQTVLEPDQPPSTPWVGYCDLGRDARETDWVAGAPAEMAARPELAAAWAQLESELERMREVYARTSHQPAAERTTDMAELVAVELDALGYTQGGDEGGEVEPGKIAPWGLAVRPALPLR